MCLCFVCFCVSVFLCSCVNVRVCARGGVFGFVNVLCACVLCLCVLCVVLYLRRCDCCVFLPL